MPKPPKSVTEYLTGEIYIAFARLELLLDRGAEVPDELRRGLSLIRRVADKIDRARPQVKADAA